LTPSFSFVLFFVLVLPSFDVLFDVSSDVHELHLSVCIICIVLNSECWTRTNDVHGWYGNGHYVPTLDKCQAVCVEDNSCVAIDWDPSNSENCWTLTSTLIGPTLDPGIVTHYELDRACLSESLFALHTTQCVLEYMIMLRLFICPVSVPFTERADTPLRRCAV